MFRLHPPLRALPKLAVILGAVGVMAMDAGCGWTARDEFLHARKVTLSATPSDGSMGAVRTRPARETGRATPLATVPEQP